MTAHKDRKRDQWSRGSSQDTHQGSLTPLHIAVWVLVIIAFVYGVYCVIDQQWVCDDAFISFRYAQNLIHGHGLVYNVGERVEGYTNFLWTIIVALGMMLKLNPEPLSIVLGGISYVVTVLTLAFMSWRLFAESQQKALFVPMTALCLLVCHDYHVFATSGLETSWVTMLISLGFAFLVLGRNRIAILSAGLVLAAAALSRPDALLFPIMAIPFVWSIGGSRVRNVVVYLFPLILIYVPYWIVRYEYYGYPFPNTYYAKSASLPYYSQGLVYLWLFVRSYYILLLVPVLVSAVLAARGRQFISLPIVTPVQRAFVLSLLFVLPYTFYVVRSGGDFMFARFWIPILPLIFLLLEICLRTILMKHRLLPFVLLAIPLAVLLRWNLYAGTDLIDRVSNEPAYYPHSWIERSKAVGTKLKRYFEGTNAKVAFVGLYACYVYYSDVPVAIEASTGLTDEYIAHLPITVRGRPGHEKLAPQKYLEQREVNFVLRGGSPMRTFADSLKHVDFGDFKSYMITYNVKLMNHLKQFDEIRFVDFPKFLDVYLQNLSRVPDSSMPSEYQAFRNYYFDHNDDPERERPFLERLARLPQK